MGSWGERRWVSEDARFACFIPIGGGQLPPTRTSNSGGLPPPPGFLPKKYRGVWVTAGSRAAQGLSPPLPRPWERKRGTLGSVSLTTRRAQHKAPSSSVWLSSILSILPPKKTLPRVVQDSAPEAYMATAGLTCCSHKYLRKLSPAGTRAWGVHWGLCLGVAAPKGPGDLPQQWPSGLLEQRQPSSPNTTPHFRSRPEASPPRQSAQH